MGVSNQFESFFLLNLMSFLTKKFQSCERQKMY